MAHDEESDPQERYFRPRPGAPGDDEAAEVEGVAFGDTESSHVRVERRSRAAPAAAVAPDGARRQRRYLVTTGLMSTAVLLFSGGGWAVQDYVLGSVRRVNAFDGLKNRPDAGPQGSMNILLAGVDRREGLTDQQIRDLHLGKADGERSDTMMLVHISSKHDKVTVVSMPRDSLVTIPAHRSNGSEGAKGTEIGERQGKLNWAYMYGGPTLAVQTVERVTGVHVDHYVEVNFLGFIKVVDALGGVTICTNQPIDDPKSGLRLPAGKSTVDGKTGLAYSRARYTLTGGSDLGRIQRQQQFMSAVAHKALSDPTKYPAVLGAALSTIRADKELSKGTLTSLATQMRGMSTDSIAFTTVPLSNPDYLTTIGGLRQSTVLWDEQAAGRLFDEIQRDKPIVEPPKPAQSASSSASPAASHTPDPNALTVAPRNITVRVVNGVGTPGLAARAAGDLRDAGFGAVVVPGARPGATATVIQYGPGREDSARTLKAAIPGARLKQVPALGSRLQVVVGPSWSGAKKVTVSPPAKAPAGDSQQQVTARTATQNLCK
ncbi:LCP family protein [Actinoallomurus soli]|uniref:LCP family protein n=1 Tax=Actinoallomurus soli TaxID=2952535 RepID=UPI002093236D|nr:LCP family protein [Actinoallomurus soli]MCO5969235.1 LCP family protein [Actinoallomurus soli]